MPILSVMWSAIVGKCHANANDYQRTLEDFFALKFVS
jgi:hypothetical protein